jgi:hypothetical protein
MLARPEMLVPELLSAMADRSTDLPRLIHRLGRIDRSYWVSHPEEMRTSLGILASLHRDKDARIYEAATDAYSLLKTQPKSVYPIEQLNPFFAAMESALPPGEHAIALRDLSSSLQSYWKARRFIQPEPTHLPAHLVQILFVGPFQENRPAYDEMLNAMRREVDPAFRPPTP